MTTRKKERRIDWARVAMEHMKPTRLRILLAMVQDTPDGEPGWSPKMLSVAMDTPLPNISYHVRELESMGIVKLVSTAPRRGAVEHYYNLEAIE